MCAASFHQRPSKTAIVRPFGYTLGTFFSRGLLVIEHFIEFVGGLFLH